MNREEIRKKLSKFTVGIAGAGGLGSNCAVALARSNIGGIVIADFDTVSEPNLDRQYFFLNQIGQPKVFAIRETIHAINPAVSVSAYYTRVSPDNITELFSLCDILVEAFDAGEEKYMLLEACARHFPGKPLVLGNGIAGWGSSNDIKVRHSGQLVIVGDESTEVGQDNPPMAARVGIAACMQANEVIQTLLSQY